MNVKGKFFSKEIVDSWPEIYGEVSFNVLPLQYIQSIIVKFNNGNIWNINLSKEIKNSNWIEFEQSLKTLLTDYNSQINSLDFKIETSQLNKDIKKMTNQFFKKINYQ